MKKLFTIIFLLLLFAFSVQSKPYYLFTDVSKSILYPSGKVTDYKPDEVTWIFDTDSSIIRVITEYEDLYIRLHCLEVFISPEDGIRSDVYETEYGTICIDFELTGNKEFLGLIWSLSGNEYIFKMR